MNGVPHILSCSSFGQNTQPLVLASAVTPRRLESWFHGDLFLGREARDHEIKNCKDNSHNNSDNCNCRKDNDINSNSILGGKCTFRQPVLKGFSAQTFNSFDTHTIVAPAERGVIPDDVTSGLRPTLVATPVIAVSKETGHRKIRGFLFGESYTDDSVGNPKVEAFAPELLIRLCPGYLDIVLDGMAGCNGRRRGVAERSREDRLLKARKREIGRAHV